MLKKLLLVTAIGVGIGILIYSYYGTVSLPTTLQNIFTQAEAAWSRLPSILKAIIPVTIGAIPTILMIFFAWSKNRAMQLTEQTKLQASQQLTQTKGEYDEKIEALNKENETLRGQMGTGATELTTKINQQDTIITKQRKQIESLTNERNEAERLANVIMHPTEAELIARLQKSGYTITKTIS